MKNAFVLLVPLSLASASAQEGNLIRLDEIGVQNLRLETALVEERDFETTVFAIGRIEEIPSRRSVLSSRIPGRVVGIEAFEGDSVEQGQLLARVESRQPGNPPPTIQLHAPQAGLVIASHVRLGEPVEPDKDLLDISDRSVMWAVAKVPEIDAANLAPGSMARLRIPAVGEQAILASMLRYGVETDRETGTVEAIFEIENPDRLLKPGMRVEFSLITATRPNVLAVPRLAVQGGPHQRVVFVKDFEVPNVFIRSPVVLGSQNEEFVEVVSGIFPGDEVVTRGSYSLGFAGSDSGMSLKEYLDAAHGHEHNPDGSEISPEQAESIRADEADGRSRHASPSLLFLQIYAGIVTVLFLVSAQLFWRARRPTAA